MMITSATDDTKPTANSSPYVDRLCEVAGRDRAVAARLREQAAKLLRLADGLDTNASIATSAAAEALTD